LPKFRNSPQVCPQGLYAEQLSGTAFTIPRELNLRSWLYRIRPSVNQGVFKPVNGEKFKNVISDFNDKNNVKVMPNQLRWRSLKDRTEPTNFIEGLFTFSGVGSPDLKNGIAIHGYSCNVSMKNEAFYNSDGDMLIVPQNGALYIVSEFGKLVVSPREIVVIPRGIKFLVEVTESSKGWIAEIYKGHFKLPDLGPIGANGLANPRDFEIPHAAFEDVDGEFKIVTKYIGEFFEATAMHSPFDVVSWHGNYYPFKYNLDHFNTMNTVSYDHPDPSIFTVLTAPSDEKGVAICDFVIFPPRWMVGEDTFRPPYYHRNYMSEFMGNIYGKYDAKGEGFGPGCSSLHLTMTSHGPDKDAFEKASFSKLEPFKLDKTLSFMFETCYMLKIAKSAINQEVAIDDKYNDCWKDMEPHFRKAKEDHKSQ